VSESEEVNEKNSIFSKATVTAVLVYAVTVNFYILLTSKLNLHTIKEIIASGNITKAIDFQIVIQALGLTETDAYIILIHVLLIGYIVGTWILGIDFPALLIKLKGKK